MDPGQDILNRDHETRVIMTHRIGRYQTRLGQNF
jgi:hypothetical protein